VTPRAPGNTWALTRARHARARTLSRRPVPVAPVEHIQGLHLRLARSGGATHHDALLSRERSRTRSGLTGLASSLQLVKAMTGAKEVNLFYDQLFVKEPGTAKETAWHTDHSYWQLQGGSVCTVWAPLDEVPETTALKYVAGSHKWQLKHQIDSFSGDQQRYAGSKGELPPLPDIDAMEASGQAKVLKWHMQPGDVLVFHSYLVHGAPGNSSSAVRRRAYVTRWANDSVRFDSRPGTMHYTWVERGGGDLDCGLVSGARLTSGLHPVVPAVA